MMMINKNTIKVTCNQETKRISAPKSYAELIAATLSSFGMDAKAA